MSWDQGIQLREELPRLFVEKIEDKFEEFYGYKAEIQYITWFGLGEEFFCDFGIDNPDIKCRSGVQWYE